eukprot:10745046-Karenia_brevis.AAC.1
MRWCQFGASALSSSLTGSARALGVPALSGQGCGPAHMLAGSGHALGRLHCLVRAAGRREGAE